HWDPTRFSVVPRITDDAQREALERIGREKLGVKKLNDWYSVTAADVHKYLGSIKKYGSLYDALKKLYPNHNWDPIRFSRVPQGYWTDVNTQRLALEKLGKQLGVKTLDDWYKMEAVNVYNVLT